MSARKGTFARQIPLLLSQAPLPVRSNFLRRSFATFPSSSVGSSQQRRTSSRRSQPEAMGTDTSAAPAPESTAFVLDSNATGTFLAARNLIVAGTLIMTDPGEVSETVNMHTIQFDKTTHINCPGPIRFTNHSCAPNCIMKVSKEPPGASLVAMQDIPQGEALCFDYASTEWEMESPFDCSCGAAACRKRVTGYKDMPTEQRAALHPDSISPWILAN
ncbi:hypothetical protein T484DRAFT_1935521 [Baffinella frigidus]|nr:hypothetical protein T484DRAFT_1935521 [Cryptophyta sp. CCMP2293]